MSHCSLITRSRIATFSSLALPSSLTFALSTTTVMTQQDLDAAISETAKCGCCIDDFESQHDAQKNDTGDGGGQPHQTSLRLDGKVECWPGCAACCHKFEHRFCGTDCAAHIGTVTNSTAVLCRGTEQTSSVSSLLECEPEHSCQHQHDGLRHRPVYRLPPAVVATVEMQSTPPNTTVSPAADDTSDSVIKGLSVVDRFLSVWIILVMIIGVLVGYYSSSAVDALNSVQIVTVSLPVSFGLWFMMYPVLVKVRYESFGAIFRKRDTYRQLLFSVSANWVRRQSDRRSSSPAHTTLLTPSLAHDFLGSSLYVVCRLCLSWLVHSSC